MSTQYVWKEARTVSSRSYRCGFCGNQLASNVGFVGESGHGSNYNGRIYVCHHCTSPTFFDHNGVQFPGVMFGDDVADVTDRSVTAMYLEARRSYGASAYTAAVLCCRKLLMHIAVAKGAQPGATFVSYVEYLAANHYVPPDARPWVDHIRKKGNESNHEIYLAKEDEAQELISFSEMLLKVIFEFPAAIRKKMKA